VEKLCAQETTWYLSAPGGEHISRLKPKIEIIGKVSLNSEFNSTSYPFKFLRLHEIIKKFPHSSANFIQK